MLSERIENAVNIAKAYRLEHNGELPALVVAHGKDETFTVVGMFRPDERGNGEKTRADQKMFVSLMRIVFEMRGVTSYEVITKPEFDTSTTANLQLTKNILSIFSVDKKGSRGSFFEIDEDELIPVYNNVEIASWFSKLLPTNFNVDIDPKTRARLEKYVKACTFVPRVEVEPQEAANPMDAVLASL